MKAKIKSTGEIINIADYAKVELASFDSYGNPIELGFDEIEILQEKNNDIDWEHRRYEIAKELMKSISASSHNQYATAEILAQWSVGGADALIAELKKGDNNE